MARARNIKPSLFKNEELGTEDPLLTILFVSLWCLADREGRLEDRPQRIKAETFPYRPEVKIDVLLTNLHKKGFITRYKVEGAQFIQVTNFARHQNPHHREKPSDLPSMPPGSQHSSHAVEKPEQALGQPSTSPEVKRSDSLIPDSLIPDSLIPDTSNHAPKKSDQDFDTFWQIYPKRPGANRTQAIKAWQARLRAGEDPRTILAGTVRYRKYCEVMQTDPQFIKQAATFLGPDKHYLMSWQPSGRNSATMDFVNRLNGRKGDDDGFTFDG